MTTTAIVLLVIYTSFAAWMCARADRRFRHHAKLPMQWGLDRRPTWYAPRRTALIVTPILGGIGFLLMALITVTSPPPPVEATAEINGLLFGLGALGMAVYAGYLWLVGRWDRAMASIAE